MLSKGTSEGLWIAVLPRGFVSLILFCFINLHKSTGKVSKCIKHLLQTIPGIP